MLLHLYRWYSSHKNCIWAETYGGFRGVCFFPVFKFESNYNLICFEFWHVLFPMLFFCFAWEGVTLLLLILTWFTWRRYIFRVLVNRGSWWDVCELIFVSPAGYVDFALSLSAGVSFQSGLLWGSMFPRTGRNFSRGYYCDFFSWLWTGGFFLALY